MEGNKDESEKCLRLAEKCIRIGEKDKAIKFLVKAEKLYPSNRAKGELLGVNCTLIIHSKFVLVEFCE